ncbi:hypothetical protein RB653_007654 [Dictyostelium firmibasis]|uniref:OTU domain-containing protein n=1 Tax=Dictyostelium firmibasis TaxID=79012 RepID=A0AAN7U1K3_9MYCE
MAKGNNKRGNNTNNNNNINSNNKKLDRQVKASLRKRKERLKHGDESWRRGIVKFQQQLEPLGFIIKDVAGDGNCLFRSIADQLQDAPNEHRKYREAICKYIERNKDMFAPFIDDEEFESFEEYIQEMREDATWGGHVEIQAASLAYNVNITIHQMDQPRWEITNHFPPEKNKTIHLSYHNDEHYNSVRPANQSLHPTKSTSSSPIPNFDNKQTFQSSSSSKGSKNSKNNGTFDYNSGGDFIEDSVYEIMTLTGETSVKNVKEALMDCNHNIEAAVEYLLALSLSKDESFIENDNNNNNSCGVDDNTSQNSGVSTDDNNDIDENKENNTPTTSNSTTTTSTTTTTTTTTTTSTTTSNTNEKGSRNPYKGIKKKENEEKKENTSDDSNVHLSNKQRKNLKQQNSNTKPKRDVHQIDRNSIVDDTVVNLGSLNI